MNAVWPHPAGQRFRTPPVVPDRLRDYGAATRRAMAPYAAAAAGAPHLGPLISEGLGAGGKMMRPAICIAATRAFGGSIEDALPCAAAIELLHNAVLVHDDIADGSKERRGRPTLHARHGVPLALNAGDAMLLLALSPLADSLRRLPPPVAAAILEQTQRMARETTEGQALELGWRDRHVADVGEADYLRMVLKKTAWMAVIWPLQVGALIGSGGRADPAALVRFGFFLGAAFQIQDDLLNLVADDRYGKEALGDLYEGKRTIMLIHARRACSQAERRRLDAFLRLDRASRSPTEVDWLADLMRRYASSHYARIFASGLAGAAEREFTQALGGLPPSRDKEFLAGLVTWVFERT